MAPAPARTTVRSHPLSCSLASVALAGVGVIGCAPAPASRAAQSHATVALSLRGAPVGDVLVSSLADGSAKAVPVYVPLEGETVPLCGARVNALLDARLGPGWRKEEDVVIACGDGYRVTVPVRRFLEHEALLATSRDDRDAFTVDEQRPDGAAKRVSVGPAWLAWTDPRGRQPPSSEWPFAVASIDVTDANAEQAPLAPPAGASAAAVRGFDRFRATCLPCHAVNGAGGRVGPELNVPRNVTEYFDGATLAVWLDDPARVRLGARMPPPSYGADAERGEARAAAIADVIAYLRAMVSAKRPPRP